MESEGSEYSTAGFDTSRDVAEHGDDTLRDLAEQLLSAQYMQLGEQAEYLSSRPTAGNTILLALSIGCAVCVIQ